MFMANVVKEIMLSEAGNRICVSIFRADDLSDDLCSNRCDSMIGSEVLTDGRTTCLELKTQNGG